MDKIETTFLTQEFKLLVCFPYIDDVFFIWTYGKKKLEEFFKDFNNYHPNIKLTHEFNKKAFPFRTLRWACLEVNWPQTCILSLLTKISSCPIHLLMQTIANVPWFLVKLWGLPGYAILKEILKDICTIWIHGSMQEAILNI